MLMVLALATLASTHQGAIGAAAESVSSARAGRKIEVSGNPIAQIDLGLVDSPVYDLSTQAGRDLYLPGNPIAQAYAQASSEVLIEGTVPSGAVQFWGWFGQ